MSIDRKDVENIAHLARLRLDPGDVAEATNSIANILRLIDEMQTVSVQDVAPLAHAFEASQPLRDDEISESDQRAVLQRIAPSVDQGLYLVPKVIE